MNKIKFSHNKIEDENPILNFGSCKTCSNKGLCDVIRIKECDDYKNKKGSI